MSGIGGWMEREGTGYGTRGLMEMSGALTLRGDERRGAYLSDGFCLFANEGTETRREPRQPLSLVRDGKNYTVVLDGWIRGGGALVWMSPDAQSAAERVLTCYLALGYGFADSLFGSFALAICDENRGELILARDRSGRRPMFYAEESRRLWFASEIRGILAGLETMPGEYRSTDTLAREIRALPPGYTAVVSRLGLTLFANEA